MPHILFVNLAVRGRVRVALYRPGEGLTASGLFEALSTEAFEQGVLTFLDTHDAPFITAAAISAPGWEQDGVQHMPNHGYEIERERLKKIFNIKRLHIVNPTVARALSIPSLTSDDYAVLSPGDATGVCEDATRCIIGTGPGLGLAILMRDSDGQWTAFSGAGGHMDLAIGSPEEYAVFKALQARYGHVSYERGVSLGGLTDIHHALGGASDSAEDIVAQAHQDDTRARQAIDLCLTWLARAASDMALITGARGGVYLSGDLVEMLLPWLNGQRFRQAFSKTGRISHYLDAVPVCLITSTNSDFNGLRTLFE